MAGNLIPSNGDVESDMASDLDPRKFDVDRGKSDVIGHVCVVFFLPKSCLLGCHWKHGYVFKDVPSWHGDVLLNAYNNATWILMLILLNDCHLSEDVVMDITASSNMSPTDGRGHWGCHRRRLKELMRVSHDIPWCMVLLTLCMWLYFGVCCTRHEYLIIHVTCTLIQIHADWCTCKCGIMIYMQF